MASDNQGLALPSSSPSSSPQEDAIQMEQKDRELDYLRHEVEQQRTKTGP